MKISPYCELSSLWDRRPGQVPRQWVHVPYSVERAAIIGRRWKLGTVKLTSDRRTRLEDFPACVLPVMSERARRLLDDLLSPDGMFAPVKLIRNGTQVPRDYVLFHCHRHLRRTAAHRPASIGRNGAAPHPQRSRGACFASVPDGVNAFRWRDTPDTLLVSRAVATLLMESGLSGWMLCDPEKPPAGTGTVVSHVVPR
ncbi:MAG: hypothetical protein KIT68_12620 [Phycisphaeraceae bacterium]|nr:hypothetical protein [Phycisphaeraceae bacterium]